MGNSNLRYLNFNADVKQAGTDIFIEGFANRFQMDGKLLVDRGNDLIPPEAFEVEEFKTLPIIFFNHDRNQPVGKATQIQKKEDGLFIKVKMSNSDHPEVSRVRTLVKEGILKAFSVGFDPIKIDQEEVEGEKVNVIKRANLLEVSIVSIPMAQHSLFNVTSKSLCEMPITTARKVLKHPEWFIKEEEDDKQGIPSQPNPAELSNPMLDIMKQGNVLLATLVREMQLLGEKIEGLRAEPEPEGEEVGTEETTEEEAVEEPAPEETSEAQEEGEAQENCDDCNSETREEEEEEEEEEEGKEGGGDEDDDEDDDKKRQQKLNLIDSYSDVCNKILKSIGY